MYNTTHADHNGRREQGAVSMKELEFYFSPFGYCTAVYDDSPNDEWDGDTGSNVRSACVELKDILYTGDSIWADLSVAAIARATSEFLYEYQAGE
jgi:hypothetical protein